MENPHRNDKIIYWCHKCHKLSFTGAKTCRHELRGQEHVESRTSFLFEGFINYANNNMEMRKM